MSANNPLLQQFDLPPYSEIRPEHVEPAVDTILGDNRVAIQELLSRPAESLDWQTLVVGLDELTVLGIEPVGKPERGEDLGSEEVVVTDDPVA